MATGQTHGGKGSSTRPTDKKKYEDNYDAIFGKKKKDKKMLEEEELLDSYITSYIIPPETDATDISVGTIKEKPKILSSRMRTPDGTILESKHRHDYVTHTDANGKEYMLDGGFDYVRCSANGDEEMLTVTSDDSHEVIREAVKWGTYGKDGDEPLKYVTISGLNPYHLRAILDTQKWNMRPALYKVMQDEVKYREAQFYDTTAAESE